MIRCAVLCGVVIVLTGGQTAELLLPQTREAYYADEAIELAVAGLAAGQKAVLELAPTEAGVQPLRCNLEGDGCTLALALPPYALAPATYAVSLDGQPTGVRITVASGICDSTLLLSQTLTPQDVVRAGGNFLVGNAFEFGLVGPDGLAMTDIRGKRSRGMEAFERATAANLRTLVYMYWTGYVTHKPWGTEKSWVEPTMQETMRLFNFHVAQRLRRYQRNIISVGTLDEPGLAWGRTPTGSSASGFPNWDEQAWYEAHGWRYTDDPASRPDSDWMKYMTLRCSILREANQQAKEDIKAVWPSALFATDLYAPLAIMDGTDPWNQQVNDICTTHVFLDWGISRSGVLSALYLEKAHEPTAKVAHAMNGQPFGEPVPQPQQRDMYRATLNALLAAGLASNWWLNCTGMTTDDLAAVNEPGRRLGPLFREMAPEDHDVAVLWSFTELAMREKEITAREAAKRPGDQLKRRLTGLPENTALPDRTAEVEVNAYSVGGDYVSQVLGMHQALSRAGYAAHILHERLLPLRALRRYRVLMVVGQTHPLPTDVMQAIRRFVDAGGTVVVDRATTVSLPRAVVAKADFRDWGYRWSALFGQPDSAFASRREASYFKTNVFMDSVSRSAVPQVKAALQQTPARPVFATDSVDFIGERHVGGDGALYMLLNARQELPQIPDTQAYFIYNYAPQTATFTLQRLPAECAVYCIEGPEWRQVARVAQPSMPHTASFAPGEMKLYLVAPRVPDGLGLIAMEQGGALTVSASLQGLKMPWPLVVQVSAPDGAELWRVYRATDASGTYKEKFPLGSNAAVGEYTVAVSSPVGDLAAQARVHVAPTAAQPASIADRVRVFDEAVIRQFLARKPNLVIVADRSGLYQHIAQRLAAELNGRRCQARVARESEITRRARYPRVWDPYIKVYRGTGGETRPEGMRVERTVALESAADGKTVARTEAGEDLSDTWQQPGTLATVVGDGYIALGSEQFYEPGCKLYVKQDGQIAVVRGQPEMVKATAEVRARWSRPWVRLSSFVGNDKLCPQLPEAYQVDEHLILLGDSTSGELMAAIQASELPLQVADAKYPGPGKALVSFVWSPFAVEKHAILIAASDEAGVRAGAEVIVAMSDE